MADLRTLLKVHEDATTLVVLDKSVQAAAPPPAPSSETVVSTYTSGAPISALQLVYVDPLTNTIFPADSTDQDCAGKIIGIATTTVAMAGMTVQVVTHGPLTDPGFSFNVTDNPCVFANGLLGQISQTAPLAPNFNLNVGSIQSANTLFVDIGDPILRN